MMCMGQTQACVYDMQDMWVGVGIACDVMATFIHESADQHNKAFVPADRT